ncbi:glycosyl hydrolase family 28-related protein [Burkholderia cenocepacia]|uniref:glycosyl hydrolase family 28-related protein n=1 Tax=Burkholderia cenocepacia TaxID=95486 RepID=UPI00222FEF18|nr:glycosyl hydrolase family 28-related protein [Burkholderia cenocepacia]MCW3657851.1 hypothetical protein [Burkholderia cenocepacia]MDS0805506.1 hypothetical protein [Burkholderia cenocepacia]
MTVNTSTQNVTYNGDGSTTAFPIPFYFLLNEDIQAAVVLDGIGTDLVFGTDFFVSGAGVPGGGTLTMFVAPRTGSQLTIQRQVAITQQREYQQNDPFPAKTTEKALDKLTMICQQIWAIFGGGSPDQSRALLLGKFDVNGRGAYRANGNRITNLADPQTDADAVNRRSMFSFVTSYVDRALAGIVGGFGWFLQAGIGAVFRTFQDKMRDIVSVKDFGAKGDGVTDDAAAINAAIATLGTQGGGDLYFPKGTYLIKSPLVIGATSAANSNIRVSGDKTASQITPGTSMQALMVITGKNTSVSGLFFNNASAFAENGILSTTASSDAGFSATIRECSFIGFNNIADGSAGISASGQNYNITGNFFQNNKTDIYFTNDGRNTTINDNYTLGSAVSVHLGVVDVQAEGTRIINNTFMPTQADGAGIRIDAGLEISIGFNIIDQTGHNTPAIYSNPAVGRAVSKVKIVGNWLAAGESSYAAFFAGNNSALEMVGNSFISNNGLASSAGVSLTDTNGFSVVGNNFGIVGGPDFSTSGAVVNGTVLGNTSNQSGSSIILNSLSQPVSVSKVDFGPVGSPNISSGARDPNGIVQPAGSVFLRSDGGAGGHVYVSQGGGTWTAVTGV